MKVKLVDVFLDTGVSVVVPDETDVSTDDGLSLVKERAKKEFARILADNGFSIQIGGEYDAGCFAERDGECNHIQCPQLENRQPHCPLE